MPRLPIELVDIVIDFLHLDDETLEVCSLVCRNWLPASRFHLFGTVRVEWSNVLSLVELLATPSSTIANHVHTLRIPLEGLDSHTIFDIIAPYLEKFVAVKSISLRGRPWFPIGDETLSRVFGRAGNMDLTEISHDFYEYRHPRFRLSFALSDNGPFTFSSRLRVLRSAFVDSTKKISWLPTIAQLPAVGRVDLFSIEENHLSTVQAILKSGGQSIRTIKLAFSVIHASIGTSNRLTVIATPSFIIDVGIDLISDYVDLTHNTNLRSLSILDLRKPNEIAGHGSFSKIIERISSFCLTHIRIGVQMHDCMDLAWLDWKKVAEELNHPRFSKLQNVCIDIMGVYGKKVSEKEEEVVAQVRREMSSLDNRILIRVIAIP
jgi:hypothetical protein